MEVLQAQLEQMVGMLSEAETKRDELQAQLTAALAAQKAAEAAAHSAKSQCAALEELSDALTLGEVPAAWRNVAPKSNKPLGSFLVDLLLTCNL